MTTTNNQPMTDLHKVLMERDGNTWQEADDLISECREDALERIGNGDMPFDICEEYFGLEPDYLHDLGII